MKFALSLLCSILFSISLIAASTTEESAIEIHIGSYDRSKNWSFRPARAVDEWHGQKAKDLQHITRQAQQDRPDKLTNFAVFRLQMVLPESKPTTLFDCSPTTVFASGGDKAFLNSLEPKLNGKSIVCAADYWHPYPDQPVDNDLRQNIAEIMGFQEALKSTEKDFITTAFKARISGEDYLTEVILRHSAISKLVNSCRASLSWNIFDDASNNLAHQLRLIDKTKKTETNWHINDLFGKAFQLNFADSEQAIRQFICALDPKKTPSVTKNTFLRFNETILPDISRYKTKWSKTKKEDAELKDLAARIDDYIARIITESGVKFNLDIASYYEMCQNCQATFQCEFLNMAVIQQKCMLFMFSGHEMHDDLRWYINGRLYQYGFAKKLPPIVSLTVSSQVLYTTTGDES